MRRALANSNSDLLGKYPNYVVRITSDEGDIGKGFLSDFMDIETTDTSPVIATTSKLLTTGGKHPDLQKHCDLCDDQLHDRVQADHREGDPHPGGLRRACSSPSLSIPAARPGCLRILISMGSRSRISTGGRDRRERRPGLRDRTGSPAVSRTSTPAPGKMEAEDLE